MIEEFVADLGERVQVTAVGRSFLIPRHFIALHGLHAWELPRTGGTIWIRRGQMIQCNVLEATHVQHKGKVYRITSKWGIDAASRLAKPSQGGFGCITDTGERVSMWDAEHYFKETTEPPFMSMWTIYFNPRDFPGKYVARRHDIFRGDRGPAASSEYFVADSLGAIRDKLPMGLVCLSRSDGDDPVILETWL
jgi:hypothetical protein